jgi:3-hydroxyacyl-[acyl-carrier-protein] dehydratase
LASPLLFDISGIDLAAIAMTPEEISRYLPQAGHMRQLDALVWKAPDARAGIGVKHVRDDEFWVPGHIPGRPLLPGVLMIEAAAQLSALLQKLRSSAPGFLGFIRCDGVAFRGKVVPGDSLYLLSREVEFRGRRFVCDTQGLVNDRLVYEGQITGMVI